MLASLLRLFTLRPLLSMAILGIPVLVLVAIGLVTVMVLKVFVFVVLPIIVIVWVARKFFGTSSSSSTDG